MELDAKSKLRRFCFLGSFEPVYVYLHGNIIVSKYWSLLQLLFKDLDDTELTLILKEALHDCVLIRKDEPLFLYAAYLAADVNVKKKRNMRLAFPTLIRNCSDLFMFCKYTSLIAKEQNRKVFSKTVCKAITAWYSNQSSDSLRLMWLTQRGQHGFTHKALIKLCHISDDMIGDSGVAIPFFKTCTQLLKEDEIQMTDINELNFEIDSSMTDGNCDINIDKTSSSLEMSRNDIISMSKLRTTKNQHEALRIIRKFNLRYEQVPRHFLNYVPIMEVLIPSMTFCQLLKCWRIINRCNHIVHPRIFKLCQVLQQKSKIHPITLLINMHKMGRKSVTNKLPLKRIEAMKMNYMNQLYDRSFNAWIPCPEQNWRMHITINLQDNYKNKILKNHRKLTFHEAAVAMAFGYFKLKKYVDVFYWTGDDNKLGIIGWFHLMNIEIANSWCWRIQNQRNKQRLVAPILQALDSRKIYDVFLCIVPTAGRGNPNQNSESLSKLFNTYRETIHSNAKFIILNLLKYRRSMTYSLTHQENILEICGLDEHTTTIIENFVNNRFN